MALKPHGLFTQETAKLIKNWLPNVSETTRTGLLNDLVYISRMGLLAEGAVIPAESKAAYPDYPTQDMVIGVKPASQPDARQTHFILSAISKSRLEKVLPSLKHCVELAITYSLADFRVQEGERSLAAQKQAVASGHSRTMNSKHLIQSDGFAHAVDLVVLTNGQVDWTFAHYANIALAMDKAATELGIAGHVRWGCAWDRVLSDFGGSPQDYLDEAQAYAKRHAGSDLLDAPHFEWVA